MPQPVVLSTCNNEICVSDSLYIMIASLCYKSQLSHVTLLLTTTILAGRAHVIFNVHILAIPAVPIPAFAPIAVRLLTCSPHLLSLPHFCSRFLSTPPLPRRTPLQASPSHSRSGHRPHAPQTNGVSGPRTIVWGLSPSTEIHNPCAARRVPICASYLY